MARAKDPDEMRVHDDIFYTTVEVRLDSYPRIKHFQYELHDLFSRFQGIYEQLPESLKLSIKMHSLNEIVHQLTKSSPTLFLFGPRHCKIPRMDLVKKDKSQSTGTHAFEEMHPLPRNEKNYKLVVAICTLRMMDTKKGRDNLIKVRDFLGVENLIFFVDKMYELNKDLLVNNLELLKDLLKQTKEDTKVVYEGKHEKISNEISTHMEHNFINAFKSLNMFLLEMTTKRSGTYGYAFGDKGTGGRFYRQIKGHFGNILTVLDLLVTARGESAEVKLAAAILSFTKTVLIPEIARTYEMQDVKVFEYWQNENYNESWILRLQQHLCTVPLVQKFYKFIKQPNDESVKSDLQNLYTLDDAKTIGKEVTKVLMTSFREVGTKVKNIRINLDFLTQLRKEVLRLLEETISREKYDERIPKLEKWRKEIEGIREVEAVSLVFRKLVVFLRTSNSIDREKEVRKKIKRSLRDYPSEVIVESGFDTFFSGRHRAGNNSQITMGNAFLSGCGYRGTIGLFMHEDESEHRDLHFITSSHTVLCSNVVRTSDPRPVHLGTMRHSLLAEDDSLFDIAAIRIERNVQNRCNIFFQDNNEICECKILDMEEISALREGMHVYKRGSATGETKGCIISEEFIKVGLEKHHFLVGLPVGVNEATRSIGFTKEGDSGAVLYTKTPDGEVHYFAMLMAEYNPRITEENINSMFIHLINKMGSPIMTTCLREGLNKIEQKFNFRLTLPTI